MKTIGLIGGMSWESSLVYYRLINEGVKTRLGRADKMKMAKALAALPFVSGSTPCIRSNRRSERRRGG